MILVKKHITNPWLVPIVLIIILGILTFILLRQYSVLLGHTQKLIHIQEQYNYYCDVIRKVLEQYPNEEFEFIFPEGSRVISSDDEDACADVILTVINRNPAYLKQSMIAYFKEQQLDELVGQLREFESVNLSNFHKPRKLHGTRKSRKKIPLLTKSGDLIPIKHSPYNFRIAWPISRGNFWISSRFGPRRKPSGVWGFHYGIDMAAVRGTPVHPAHKGIIEQAGYVSGYGNTILINHYNGFKTRYAHLNSIKVGTGQEVTTKDILGTVGATGFTIKTGKDASHLHFEVYDHGKQVNPLLLLS